MLSRRPFSVALVSASLLLGGGEPLAAGTLLFEDGFESGDTSAWSSTVPPPCTRSCGAVELCDVAHRGFDDNCDGAVDEGCSCLPGSAQACFRGDPSQRSAPGCYPGVQSCSAASTWGPCVGGVHATESCFATDLTACHAIATNAFVPSDLTSGLGLFGTGALSESWEVACPDGLATCPLPVAQSDYWPMTVGEHGVLYTKTTASGTEQCTYPLFVGGPGALRIELHWENDLGGTGVDLDLHLHEPGDLTPWGGAQGSPVDCAWDNCTATSLDFPDWFTGTQPPAPVSWYLDPILENNTCYFAPRGYGGVWQSIGLGCHHPRLDVEQISCDPADRDPFSGALCTGEVDSIDYMPQETWTRMAVHYFSAHGESYDVHPVVKIFCSGALAAELGPRGYYVPEAPVTFPASSGSTRFWLVADVAFGVDAYGTPRCLVRPVYADAALRTPLLTTAAIATTDFGPPLPAPPDFGPTACPE